MKRVVVLALLCAVAGCSGSDLGKPMPTAQDQAAVAAQRILAGVPISLGGDVTITGAKADGRTLVVALTGMTDWRPNYTDAVMATTMKRGLCFQPGVEEALAAGGRIRLESRTAAGQNLPPLTIDRC